MTRSTGQRENGQHKTVLIGYGNFQHNYLYGMTMTNAMPQDMCIEFDVAFTIFPFYSKLIPQNSEITLVITMHRLIQIGIYFTSQCLWVLDASGFLDTFFNLFMLSTLNMPMTKKDANRFFANDSNCIDLNGTAVNHDGPRSESKFLF